MARVLLTSAVGPYDTHYYNQSLTDVMDQRFSRGCGIFTMRGHIHCNFAHALAQNIQAPTVFLEYPRQEDYETELRAGYDIVGINGFHNQRDVVVQMCKRARELAPRSRILLGGWAGVAISEIYKKEEWRQFADDICLGEGIRYMRQALGEDPEAPIRITHLPKSAAFLPWLDEHPPGDMGCVIASLGCPNGCDFCGTTHLFDRRRLRLLDARQTFDEFTRYFRENPKLMSMNLIEEDSFADRQFMSELSELIQNDQEFGLEKLNFFCLSSNQSLSRWDFDDILKTGVMSIFIGVESKFASEAGYHKREGRSIEETFRELHRRGIGTIGAWMCGFDFQTRENIEEDLANFVSLEPTFQQLTRLCPFPGTPMWDRMVEEGRIEPRAVPCETISFFGGGGLTPKSFYEHEVMEIVERGYRTLYETWGACLLRQWKVNLNGFEYCSAHDDPIVQRRAGFHRWVARDLYPLSSAMEVFAPNGTVRKRVRDQRARYHRLLGEPDVGQRISEQMVLRAARRAARNEIDNPIGLHPKEEPYKRYDYHRRSKPGECPYTVTHPRRELSYRIYEMNRRSRNFVLDGISSAVTMARRWRDQAQAPRESRRRRPTRVV